MGESDPEYIYASFLPSVLSFAIFVGSDVSKQETREVGMGRDASEDIDKGGLSGHFSSSRNFLFFRKLLAHLSLKLLFLLIECFARVRGG